MATALPTVSITSHNHAAASVMARILSSENISVIIDASASTAAFDLKNRTLILPQWKDMSKTVYDMLIGHEISHALHTPCDGWKIAIDAMSGTTNSSNDVWQTASLYLNVVEDARIERLIKNKFPGFKRDFVAGYGELAAKDFFGIKKIDMNKLELADRLNLYYKLGTIGSVGIRFTAEEQVFITRIDASQSFEDAAQIAQDLFTHCKNKKAEDKKQNEQGNPLKDCNGGKSEDKQEAQQEQSSTAPKGSEKKDEEKSDKSDKSESKESDSTEGGDEQSKSEGEGAEQGEKTEESATQEKQDEPSKDGARSDANGSSDQAPTPITQQKLEESLKKSVKKHRGYGETINAPAKLIHCDLAKVVFDYKQCMEFMKKDCPSFFTDSAVREAYDAVQDAFDIKCKHNVDQLSKQFELRKAAMVSKRASIRNTGVLDTVRMVNYKWSEDIFRRNTILPEGKNHGLVMFVDWSGSMSACIESVLEQTMVLCDFCRRSGIPFEVYAFTTRDFSSGEDCHSNRPSKSGVWKDGMYEGFTTNAEKEAAIRANGFTQPAAADQFSLFNMFSSRMTKQEYRTCKYWYRALTTSKAIGKCRLYPQLRWELSGTALDETIVAAMQIVPQFKEQHKLDIVNTIFLTDGDSSVAYMNGSQTLIDPKTRAVYSNADIRKNMGAAITEDTQLNTTNVLLTAFREITGSRAIGMFLCNGVAQVNLFFAKQFAAAVSRSEREQIAASGNSAQSYRQGYIHDCALRVASDVVRREMNAQLKQDNVVCADAGCTGYDEYFFIQSIVDMDGDKAMDALTSKSSQLTIKKAFSKSCASRNKGRVLVNRFIELIAR